MRGVPLKEEDVAEDARGRVSLQTLEKEEWTEMTSPEEELSKLAVVQEELVGGDLVPPAPPPLPLSRSTSRTSSKEEEEEEDTQGRSRASSTTNSKNGEDVISSLTVADLALETEEEMIDLEEEEALVDDPVSYIFVCKY